MDQAQERLESLWRCAIKQGEAEPGGDVPYTSDTARKIAQDAVHALASSDPIDPDVLP